jgi:hypothetical protein
MKAVVLTKVQREIEKNFTPEKIEVYITTLRSSIINMASNAPNMSMQNTELEIAEYDDFRNALRELSKLSLMLEGLQYAQETD